MIPLGIGGTGGPTITGGPPAGAWIGWGIGWGGKLMVIGGGG